MRTGAIFARGSCRALKWVALVGMVFALGADQVAAQVKISGDKGVKGDEGGRVTITVSADVRVAPGQSDEQTVSIAAPTASTTGITVDNAKMVTPADGGRNCRGRGRHHADSTSDHDHTGEPEHCDPAR